MRGEELLDEIPRVHQQYRMRMRDSRPFQFFGLTPIWQPGEQDVDGYIRDEVVRQGHDPRVPDDGGCRVLWMGMAWAYAVASKHPEPTLQDVLTIGGLVEQQENAHGFRMGNVYIGNRTGANPARLHEFVSLLLDALPVAPEEYRIGDHPNAMSDDLFKLSVSRIRTATDWYLAYEYVHPFSDGNGRSGKVLFNWLLGTLDDPVLPADFFGGGNP